MKKTFLILNLNLNLILNLFIIFVFAFPFALASAQTNTQVYSESMNAYHAKDYATADRLFQKFFSEYKLEDALYATLKYYDADALLNLGKKSAAAGVFEYLVNQFTWSSFRDKALYKLGLIYYEQEQYDKCRARLKKILDEYPASSYTGSALYWIGESYSKQNRLQEAIVFLKEAIKNHPFNKYIDYSIYTLARIYEKTGDYEDAVKYYDNLLSYHSDSPLATAAHIRIGICYFKLKEYDSSVLELNNPVLKDLPDEVYSQSIYILANSYYRLKDYKNAEKSYMEIINRFPSSGETRDAKYGLAWSYFQQKMYNDAYKLFNFLSAGNDSLAVKSFYWKAECKRYTGQDLAAFNIYREFMRRYPNNELIPDVQFQLGVYYYNTGKYEMGIRYLKSALKSPNEDIRVKALTMIGEINLTQKDYTSAKKNFTNAINSKGLSDDLINRASFGLGVAQYYSGNYNEAVTDMLDVNYRDPRFEKDKINFYLAESYYSLNKYRDAIERYNLVGTDNKELHGLALYGKAYCYFNLGNYSEAARQFSVFVKEFPHDSRALDAKLRLADSYYGSKNFAASSQIYKQIFRFDKRALNNPYDYYQYAQALYRANERQEAIDEFKTLQQRFPTSEYADRSLFVVGWIYFQEGNYEQAISSYMNVLNVYPNSTLGATVYYSAGDSYFNMGKYDSAIANYQQVLVRYPASPHVYDAVNGIGDSYVAQDHPERAIKFIKQFVNQNPSLSFADQIFYKIGDMYYSSQEYKKASTSYKEFIANYPNSRLIPQAYYWIGKSAENLKQNQEAIFNFERVFNTYPASDAAPSSVIEMGNIYNQMKKYDTAISLYNKALTTLPNTLRYPEIMYNEGMTYLNKTSPDSAAQVFNQIIQNYDGTVFAEKSKLQLGLISMRAKQYADAQPYFQVLAQNRTDDIGAQAQYYLGESYLEQQDYNDAITAFVRVETIFPAYDEWVTKAYLKLGDCYADTKDFSRAKEMYRIVFTKHKGDIYGKEARTKLRKLK